MTWLRALAAAGLSVLLPGAGHALIRDWARAIIFTGLYFATIAFLVTTDQLATASSISEAMRISSEISTRNWFILSFIVLFATIDATFRAMRYPLGSNQTGDGPSCPECGKELDEELSFCHWCTTRIEPPAATDAEEEPARS